MKRDTAERILINILPAILTIHLNMFSQDTCGCLCKLNGHVDFIDTIDLKPYMDPRYSYNSFLDELLLAHASTAFLSLFPLLSNVISSNHWTNLFSPPNFIFDFLCFLNKVAVIMHVFVILYLLYLLFDICGKFLVRHHGR